MIINLVLIIDFSLSLSNFIPFSISYIFFNFCTFSSVFIDFFFLKMWCFVVCDLNSIFFQISYYRFICSIHKFLLGKKLSVKRSESKFKLNCEICFSLKCNCSDKNIEIGHFGLILCDNVTLFFTLKCSLQSPIPNQSR